MLRITVELLPGGREAGKRTLAVAEVGNVGGGAKSDYRVRLMEENVPDVEAEVRRYPRWSAPIWDLVARCICKALAGTERLPARPKLLAVPVRHKGNTSYVRVADIPEPTRSTFLRRMAHSTRPLIEDDPDPMGCAYAWDWEDFLSGQR